VPGGRVTLSDIMVSLSILVELFIDLPMPITTRNPVANRPRSIHALELLSIKSSGLAHLAAIQFGTGAST
jgi:hypothetical protein